MVLATIKNAYPKLFPAEKKVADYILRNPNSVINMSVGELADISKTSEATVVRLCRRLGFNGFYQFKIALAGDGTSRKLVEYRGEQNDPKTVRSILQEISGGVLSISDEIDSTTILKCAKAIRESAMVHVVAVGNTCPVAMDFAFRLGRLGIRTSSSFVSEYIMNTLNLGRKEDLLIAISHSGSSIQVIQAMDMATNKGMKTIAFTDTKQSPLGKKAQLSICIPQHGNLFQGFGAVSNIYTLALVDVVLYFVANLDSTTTDADTLEMILANYKM